MIGLDDSERGCQEVFVYKMGIENGIQALNTPKRWGKCFPSLKSCSFLPFIERMYWST